jgi:hypothetical protein
MTKIQYENLTIRQAEVADAKQLAAWWNDGAVMAHAGLPNGLGTTEGAFLHRCTFENWEIGAYGGLGSWVNATGCTFRGNDVGLWLDNRGGATCSGSYYGDSVYEDNGTAVRIAAMPGTETLDFNNCVFRGNGVNVENTAGYAADLSQIVTADN